MVKIVPTVVFKNGLVYSVGKEKSRSQAIAIVKDKILFTGTDAEVEGYIGASPKVIDLKGKMVLPGFVDAHAHPSHAMDFVGNISLYLLDSPEKYLEETLESIFAQTYKYWELVIINDGSTDSTQELLDFMREKDPRVTLLKNDGNFGSHS